MKDLKKYETAEVEIVVIEAADVITTSGENDFDGSPEKW